MKIESVDLFYLSMPVVHDIGDGSQDALLVRVQAGGYTGWGECEASPLVCLANWVCPMSHSACKPVKASVLGQRLDSPADIPRINRLVRENGLDIAQTDHTLSGIDIALWDLLGRKLGQPVYELLGYPRALPKIPYASQLFGNDPAQTFAKARAARALGFRVVKFGWGPFGRGTADEDAAQLASAREGLGEDATLLVDAGTVWGDDVEQARRRLSALREQRAAWLEEPFVGGAVSAYKELAASAGPVKLAGGEGARNFYEAQHLIDHGSIGFIQIDTGRIGGITTAKQVADYAAARDVTFVNHTFTTHLALSASLQPFAGLPGAEWCEYPFEPSRLAHELTGQHIVPDTDGRVRAPSAAGLGVVPDPQVIARYLVDAEIRVGGQLLYRTPQVPAS